MCKLRNNIDIKFIFPSIGEHLQQAKMNETVLLKDSRRELSFMEFEICVALTNQKLQPFLYIHLLLVANK